MKYPWMQFFAADWLNDPALSMCQPETRGIWMDLICAMHLSDRSGTITGTHSQLARVARCTEAQLTAAINDIQTCKAADVTLCNKNVTLVNRRMKREHNERNNTKLRVRKFRRNGDCNGAETDISHISEYKVPPFPPAIEPQKGFPSTVTEARERAGMVGISDADFISKVWNKAMSRGGCDQAGMPIRSFAHWIQAEWSYEQDRKARDKNYATNRRPDSQSIDRNAGTFNADKSSLYAGIKSK